jgi:hypothetical protein
MRDDRNGLAAHPPDEPLKVVRDARDHDVELRRAADQHEAVSDRVRELQRHGLRRIAKALDRDQEREHQGEDEDGCDPCDRQREREHGDRAEKAEERERLSPPGLPDPPEPQAALEGGGELLEDHVREDGQHPDQDGLSLRRLERVRPPGFGQ